MSVVVETGPVDVLDRGQPAAGHGKPLQADRFKAGQAQVALQHQRVVARADYDSIIGR